MKKPAIPSIPNPGESRTRFDSTVKEGLEIIMGRRKGVQPLDLLDPTTATAEDCANKINEILARLQ